MVRRISLILMLSIAAAGCSTAAVSPGNTESIIAGWPSVPQDVARKTMAKYGPPNEATATMLVWHNNGPWKRTIIYRDEVAHDFPKPHTDLLQQFINYEVPAGRHDEIAAYDGSVVVERTNGEISARCDKEEMNFLALNLAHDVATGKRSVEAARQFYAETVMATMKGEMPPYVQRLQFEAARTGTADPDKSVLPK